MSDSQQSPNAARIYRYFNNPRRAYCSTRLGDPNHHGKESKLDRLATAAVQRIEEERKKILEQMVEESKEFCEKSSKKTNIGGVGLISPAYSVGKAVCTAEISAVFPTTAEERDEEVLLATPPRDILEGEVERAEKTEARELHKEESPELSIKVKGKGRAIVESQAPAAPPHETEELGRGKRKRTQTIKSQEAVPKKKSLIVRLAVKNQDKGKGRTKSDYEKSVLSSSGRLSNAKEDLATAKEGLAAAEKDVKDLEDAGIDTDDCWRTKELIQPWEKKARDATFKLEVRSTRASSPLEPSKEKTKNTRNTKSTKNIKKTKNTKKTKKTKNQFPKTTQPVLPCPMVYTPDEDNKWCNMCSKARDKLANDIDEATERAEYAWREVERLEALVLELEEEVREEERKRLSEEVYKLNAEAFVERLKALSDALNDGGFDWENEML